MGKLPPVKPTGGAIAIATAVGLAGAAACTQLLTLNMPFGGKLPDTVTNSEWAKATADMQKAWPREGAPDRPVKLNPMFGK